MDVRRRTVVKGMIAGGAVLATGMARWAAANDAARDARRCLLLLGGSDCDGRFADGVGEGAEKVGVRAVSRIAFATEDVDAHARLFREHAGSRLIGIADDAAYAVFHESMRTAGARLLYLGRHSAGPDPFMSRHALLSTSVLPAVGAAVARSLAGSGCSFVMTESRLGAQERDMALSTSIPGFHSYEMGVPARHALHVSGLSMGAACELLGIDRACARAVPAAAEVPLADSTNRGWVETVGCALIRTLVEMIPAPVFPADQHTFVHRNSAAERAESVDACVTFVIDV